MVNRQAHIRERTVDQKIRVLEEYVRHFECHYERTSGNMVAAVRDGKIAETTEIVRWLTRYKALTRLHDLTSRTTGSIGTNTTKST